MSRGMVVAGLVVVLAVFLIMRPGGDVDEGAEAEPEVEAPASPMVRARRGELELAVSTAAGSAECGFTDVGYGRVEPGDAAGRLVERMRSASAPAPGDPPAPPGAVEYVEGPPERAWQVAVRLAPDSSALLIEGFGTDLEEPLVSRSVPCG